MRARLRGLVLQLMTRAREYEHKQVLEQCAAVGRRVRLRLPVVIYDPDQLRIGDDVDIGEFSHLRASGGLTIGSRVLMASHVVITTRAHPLMPPRSNVTTDAPVRIEDDVWIGAGAIVLPGVTVGAGAVIGAGAVVTDNVAPMTVVAGVPARTIRQVTA